MDEEPKRIPVNGVELSWQRWGDDPGTALVLVHGFTGSAHDFALLVERLSVDRRVITVDLRGHGLSEHTGTLDGYTTAQLADDLGLFLERVAGAPVDLLGHSMGGFVVLRLALDRPDLVRSLLLQDTSGWSFMPDDGSRRRLLVQFFQSFDPALGSPPASMFDSPEDGLIETATPAEWRVLREERRAGTDPYAIKALGEELLVVGPESLRRRLGAIGCPVTVIVGSEDHPFVDQARELAGVVSDGRFVIIDGGFHAPQLTHPIEWGRAVDEHLERTSTGHARGARETANARLASGGHRPVQPPSPDTKLLSGGMWVGSDQEQRGREGKVQPSSLETKKGPS